MKRLIFILPALAGCFPFAAQAKNEIDTSEWLLVSQDSNGSKFYAGKNKYAPVLIKDDVVSAWILGDHSADKTVRYRRAMVKYEVRCKGDEMARRAIVLYDANGSVMRTTISQYGSFEPIIPESVGEAIFNAVCYDINGDRPGG